MRVSIYLLVLVASLASVADVSATYSIVARDPQTGELGVAVQSHWFSVGPAVAWARAGVGAVATQSLVDVTYGPLGLDLMAAGRSPERTLAGLLEADEHPDIRQVAMIDTQGRVATHTGQRCIPHAGHVTGEGYSVQANLMDTDTVPQAMAEAFEAATGPLAERLLAALDAAQAEGGDIRGQQSAALLVVRGESSGQPWNDVVVDLRVDDHPRPLTELRRLYTVHRGYQAMNEGDLATERGDAEEASRRYDEAERILGDNLEAKFWRAVTMVNAGDLESALPIFAEVFAAGENWRRLTPRLVEVGFLEADAEQLERILSAR